VSEPEQPSGGGGGGLPRLPPGRHGLPREFVVTNQRDRLAAAMIKTVGRQGYHETTVVEVAKAAGVSRRTYYVLFSSKAECFLATYAMLSDFLFEAIAEEEAGKRGWAAKVGARLAALLGVFGANPDLALFVLAVPPAAGGEIHAPYRRFLERLLGVLTEGRPKNVRKVSSGAEHGMMGGLVALIVDQVRAGEGAKLPELLPDLVELVLTPYLGRQRAVAEAPR
jgi:AcrR family transcriptional regulator